MSGRKRTLRTGSRTKGRGRKGGRGAGKRGGRGMAGTHKHRYIWVVKYFPDYFGRHGFKRPQSVVFSNEVINIDRVLEVSKHTAGDKEPEKKDGRIVIDLRALGFDKLLGNGTIDKPVLVRVGKASREAVEKIKAAGGKVEII